MALTPKKDDRTEDEPTVQFEGATNNDRYERKRTLSWPPATTTLPTSSTNQLGNYDHRRDRSSAQRQVVVDPTTLFIRTYVLLLS